MNEACTSYELPDLGKAVRCVLLLYVQQEADAAVVFGQVALCRLHPSAVTWERAVTRQRRRAPNPRWRRPDDTPPAVRVVPWRAVYLLTTRSRGTRHSRHAARRTTAVARRSRRSKTFAVEAAQRDWLDTMAAAWQLPDTGKALRVVLEYAVADTDPHSVFGVVRKACTHGPGCVSCAAAGAGGGGTGTTTFVVSKGKAKPAATVRAAVLTVLRADQLAAVHAGTPSPTAMALRACGDALGGVLLWAEYVPRVMGWAGLHPQSGWRTPLL